MSEVVNNTPAADVNSRDVKPKKNLIAFFSVLGLIVIGAALVFCYWFFIAQYRVVTNDAYIEGNIIEVFPRVNGMIQTVAVNDTDQVCEGQILATLDPTNFRIQFEESKANLAATLRNVQQMFDQVAELVAALDEQLIYVDQAKSHFLNRQALVGIGGVSKENFADAQSALLAAEAELVRIQEKLNAAQTQTYNTTVLTHPLVQSAIEQLRLCWLNLGYTEIRAPFSGFIAKKNVQVGESAAPSKSLMAIVPLDNVWVTANLKEIQLSKIRIGQEVEIITDMYKKNMPFRGKVLGISPGTGSVFSILPPQNATGNWIKIVQRVPVRIGLTSREVMQNPLRLGLSATVTIDVHDQNGEVLTELRAAAPIYQTDIYENQLKDVDSIVSQIVQANLNLNNDNEL